MRKGLDVPSRKLTIPPPAGDIPDRGDAGWWRRPAPGLLIIRQVPRRKGEATFYFTLLRSAGGTVRLHDPLRPWSDTTTSSTLC
jgi:hypothetical protein